MRDEAVAPEIEINELQVQLFTSMFINITHDLKVKVIKQKQKAKYLREKMLTKFAKCQACSLKNVRKKYISLL